MSRLCISNQVVTLAGLFFLLSAVPARADSIPASFDINGSMTLTGNNSCSGPCVETINFSFALEYAASCIYGACVVGPVHTSESGPLGIFNAPYDLSVDRGYYLGFFNATPTRAGDEIDLYLNLFNSSGNPGPTALPSDLYACETANCVNDGFNRYPGTGGLAGFGLYNFDVAAQFTATKVPEPSTWSLLACGIIALGLLRAAARKTDSAK
jgi:hypothetical protein